MTRPFADHFSPLAADYAAARPTYPDELLAYCASLAPAHRHAWDCGAGSGQATIALARHFERVTATDASEAQLSQAPPLANVEYRAAPAEASGLAGRSVDLVIVAQALHWFDLSGFFAEVRRVLVDDGIVAVWCYGLPTLGDEAIDRALRRFYTDVVGPYWAPERRLVETGYRSVPFPFDELPSPPFEMAVRWPLPSLLAYIGTWSATARYVAERGEDPLPVLATELAPRWGAPEAPRLMRWPLSVRLGRVPGSA